MRSLHARYYYPHQERALKYADTPRRAEIYSLYGKHDSDINEVSKVLGCTPENVQKVVRNISLAAGIEPIDIIKPKREEPYRMVDKARQKAAIWNNQWLLRPTTRPPSKEYMSYRG